jgi:hypothetical protein
MNVWRRGSLSRNPYERTAFRVARVPREVVRRRTVIQMITQTKRIAERDPKSCAIHGQPVTLEEINGAEQILLSPPQRILEELLTHRSERLPLTQVESLARDAEELIRSELADGLKPVDMSSRRILLREFVRRYLERVGTTGPGVGALELTLAPPFGFGERR